VKGYYDVERDLVREIKAKVAPSHNGPFKTIECSIMDLADDIAYSTYDLEDAFKADGGSYSRRKDSNCQ
jgi:dGTPase